MGLNWKDTWATVLVLAAVAAYAAHLALRDVPFAGDVRIASAACFALGVSAAVVGGWHRPVDARSLRFGAWTGSTASVLGAVAVLTAQPWALALLVLNTLALWVFATLSHTGLLAGKTPDGAVHQPEGTAARPWPRREQERS